MRQITFAQPGSPEVLKLTDGPKPFPKSGEVLIRVQYAGVNRPDILQRKGAYPPPPGASPILGLEVSGTIESLGEDVTQWKVGDAVCALTPGGGYAEYCIAPAGQCLPVPKGLTLEEAAGIPEAYFTVWTNLFERGRLAAGESVLIHGGSSGIGTTAIQLARAWGAKIFVTAGSDEKCRACLDLGASGAVNYKTQDFLTEIRTMNSGQGMDVILDMVAGDYFPKNLELLAQEGRLVHIATQKGEQVQLSIRTLMSKCATITGSTLRPRTAAEKERIARGLHDKIWPFLESRKVRVLIDSRFPLAQADQAHRRLDKIIFWIV